MKEKLVCPKCNKKLDGVKMVTEIIEKVTPNGQVIDNACKIEQVEGNMSLYCPLCYARITCLLDCKIDRKIFVGN